MIRDTDTTQIIYSARVCASRGRQLADPTSRARKSEEPWEQVLELGSGQYINTITSVAKDNYIWILC